MRHGLVTGTLGMALALGGCVVTTGFVRSNHVSAPVLIGALVADFVITTIVASQAESLSAGGSVATGLAVTGVDAGIGCLLGACSVVRL